MSVRNRIMITALLLLSIATLGYCYPRAVLMEEFMSSTCGPCATASLWLDPFILETGQSQFPTVMYHMNWPSPGNDPWFAADSNELKARQIYYNCNAIPQHMVDGIINVPNPGTAATDLASMTTAFNTRRAIPSPVWLNVTSSVGNGDTIFVTIKAVSIQQVSGYRLRAALVERHEHWTTQAPNGMTDFEFPFVKFSPDPNGFVYTSSGDIGDTLTFHGWFAPRTTGLEPYTLDNCDVVAFVQNDISKEVIQSAFCHGVVSPFPTTTAFIGQQSSIRWNPLFADTMNIFFNRDYPTGNWDTIASGIPNSGMYPWSVTGPASGNAAIIIASRSNAANADTTIFSIANSVAATASPTSLTATMGVNDTLTQTITINNPDETTTFSASTFVTTGLNSYTYTSSAQTNPPAQWLDISSSPHIGPRGDDVVSPDSTIAVLPFHFPFYGHLYDSVWMCTNGWITFNRPTTGSYHRNPLPVTDFQSAMVLCWNDLFVSGDTGYCRWDTSADQAVFSFINIRRRNNTTSHINVQAVIHRDGSFEFNYDTVSINDASFNCFAGIQSEDRSQALNLFAMVTPTSHISYRFRYSPLWATAGVTTFSVPPGGSFQLPVHFDTHSMTPGTVSGYLEIDGNNTPIMIPVTCTVNATSAPEAAAIPKGFALESVYPNPFNPTTVVKFHIANAGQVTLKLYDVMGRLVRTEINGKLAAGGYTHTIHGDNLATGTYFLRLAEGNNNTAVRKLVLIK